MRPQRSAAARTFSARSLVGASGANSCSRVDWATTTASGIVQLVRHAGQQRPHRRHLLVLVQLFALAVDLGLGAPLLPEIADRAEEQPPVRDLHFGGRQLDRKDLPIGVLGDRFHALADHRSAATGHVVGAGGISLAVEMRHDGIAAGPCRGWRCA